MVHHLCNGAFEKKINDLDPFYEYIMWKKEHVLTDMSMWSFFKGEQIYGINCCAENSN